MRDVALAAFPFPDMSPVLQYVTGAITLLTIAAGAYAAFRQADSKALRAEVADLERTNARYKSERDEARTERDAYRAERDVLKRLVTGGQQLEELATTLDAHHTASERHWERAHSDLSGIQSDTAETRRIVQKGASA